MAAEFDKILNSNENIIWQGNPQIEPVIYGNVLISIPLTILFFYLGFYNLDGYVPVFGYGFLLLGFLTLFSPIYENFLYLNTFYAITNKRVIIQSGIIGTDFQIIDFDKINNMQVKVGIIDKLFGNNSGTISIDSGRVATTSKGGTYSVPHSLWFITDPYTVFEQLKKVSHDIKTDIEYPNKLRPETNPGYNTKY